MWAQISGISFGGRPALDPLPFVESIAEVPIRPELLADRAPELDATTEDKLRVLLS